MSGARNASRARRVRYDRLMPSERDVSVRLASPDHRMAVPTGGEPLLQVDAALIEALKARGSYVAVETNGTRALQALLDWVSSVRRPMCRSSCAWSTD
jgi:organic radical activating enzyme